MAQIREWLEAHLPALQLLGFCSLIMLLITLVAVPVVVALLPENYFAAKRRKPARRSGRSFLFRIGFIVTKNLLGIIIIIVGLALLFLPGQGVITILIGLALTNFPGKFAIERRIARQPQVRQTLNWIRVKACKPPFKV
jgi:hypothetical protein